MQGADDEVAIVEEVREYYASLDPERFPALSGVTEYPSARSTPSSPTRWSCSSTAWSPALKTATRVLDRMRRLATWRRAVGLLRDFRYEQSDPARFYGALARDTATMVDAVVGIDGAVVLDVGAGPATSPTRLPSVGRTTWRSTPTPGSCGLRVWPTARPSARRGGAAVRRRIGGRVPLVQRRRAHPDRGRWPTR